MVFATLNWFHAAFLSKYWDQTSGNFNWTPLLWMIQQPHIFLMFISLFAHVNPYSCTDILLVSLSDGPETPACCGTSSSPLISSEMTFIWADKWIPDSLIKLPVSLALILSLRFSWACRRERTLGGEDWCRDTDVVTASPPPSHTHTHTDISKPDETRASHPMCVMVSVASDAGFEIIIEMRQTNTVKISLWVVHQRKRNICGCAALICIRITNIYYIIILYIEYLSKMKPLKKISFVWK